MGLFDRKRQAHREQEREREFQSKFDAFIRNGRIGPALVQAYNQNCTASLTLEWVRFYLGHVGSPTNLFSISVCPIENGRVWSALLAKLPSHMPDQTLTAEEWVGLKQFTENLPSSS